VNDPTTALRELAHACGVSTEFWDWQGRHTEVTEETIRTVLAALDVDASTPEAVAGSLAEVSTRAWRRVLPPVVVMREGWTPWVPVHVPHGTAIAVELALEDGSTRPVRQVDHYVPPQLIDGREIGEATVELPGDLPLGWHTLRARYGDQVATARVVVTPQRLRLPERLERGQVWGLMAQLYQVRSERSWGIGDLSDLADLCTWGARDLNADFVLINPLHAAEPVAPMEPSPYLPTTRRFVNPIYVRVEDIPEVAYLRGPARKAVSGAATKASALNAGPTIDRDAAWELKVEALRAVYAVPRSPGRQRELDAFLAEQGTGLVAFATWCALATRFGTDATIGDAGAVVSLVAPELLTWAEHPVRVELAGTWSRGRTIVDQRTASPDRDHDPHGPSPTVVRVALGIDGPAVARLWRHTVTGEAHHDAPGTDDGRPT
jgi:4-alpha-glucanotransferase